MRQGQVLHHFNPRPPWGGRHSVVTASRPQRDFNPRPPWGGRQFRPVPYTNYSHFNPRPPWGGRPSSEAPVVLITVFQSTPSVGRATRIKLPFEKLREIFQSTPSVGRATKNAQPQSHTSQISIHALRGEGDMGYIGILWVEEISIHALRGEGDDSGGLCRILHHHFNPRPPWGGRRRHYRRCVSEHYFNPRPPWGGRRCLVFACRSESSFQSTPSVGRATRLLTPSRTEVTISIHALRGEGDRQIWNEDLYSMISIHALRGEGDSPERLGCGGCGDFNPRPPWGGRLVNLGQTGNASQFQSTPSVGRATILAGCPSQVHTLFQSTPSVGRATAVLSDLIFNFLFQSTPSVGRATAKGTNRFPVFCLPFVQKSTNCCTLLPEAFPFVAKTGCSGLLVRANLTGNSCQLPLRITASAILPRRTPLSPQSAQFLFDNDSPGYRNAGCPSPGQSVRSALPEAVGTVPHPVSTQTQSFEPSAHS